MGKVVSKVTDAVGLTDSTAGQGAMGQANAYMAEVLNRLDKIDMPEYEKLRVLSGELSPGEIVGLMEAYDVQPSEYADIVTDPRLVSAQMAQLNALRDLSESGMNLRDRLEFEDLQRAAQAESQAQQATTLANAAQRGALDSGGTLAAMLQMSQIAPNRMSRESSDLAARSQDARMRAMRETGQLASNIRKQSFQEQAQAAQAQDAINRFNTQNRMATQQYNLGLRQRKEDERAAMENQRIMQNKQLDTGTPQTEFEFRKAGATGGALQNMSNMAMQQGQARQQSAANRTSGLISAGLGIGQLAMMSDEERKENKRSASEDDIRSSIQDLMSKLKAYEYKYKEPQEEFEGNQLGIMAQDLEKSEMGKEMVSEDEKGRKMVDVAKSSLAALAGVSDLDERLRKLEGK